MEKIENILLDRKSIRRYERRAIEPEKLDFIYRVIQNTPTSYNGQQFSVVVATDQTLKEQLYEITGQKQIKTCAAFFIFCIDYHQLKIAGAAKGITAAESKRTINGYTVGVVDAALAMGNAVVAAEAMGLGCCCIGYTRTANPRKISDILGLPEGVAIVCGLSVGYPAEQPDLKPKRPVSLVIHENKYKSDAEMVPELVAYDELVTKYNGERSGGKTANDWTGHILDYHESALEHEISGYLKEQGFFELLTLNKIK